MDLGGTHLQPSTQQLEAEDREFQASLGYIRRPCWNRSGWAGNVDPRLLWNASQPWRDFEGGLIHQEPWGPLEKDVGHVSRSWAL